MVGSVSVGSDIAGGNVSRGGDVVGESVSVGSDAAGGNVSRGGPAL